VTVEQSVLWVAVHTEGTIHKASLKPNTPLSPKLWYELRIYKIPSRIWTFDIRLHVQKTSKSGSYLGSLEFKPRQAHRLSRPTIIHQFKSECTFPLRTNVVKQTTEWLVSYCVLSINDVHILGWVFVRISEKYAASFFRAECYAKNWNLYIRLM
jgi:hypothetical protein